ncbi:biopolymer transporter ExbD [Rhodobacteraceae bacterium WD3A24]|nr:biopolymer transporter ExbD [Rhodobacteraceae bacterium WD3A24]
MTFALERPARRRKIGLTPMIDVVFLLLVFFMLAARFGLEGTLPVALPAAGEPTQWRGPPRLVEVGRETVRLNGVLADTAGLAAALAPLMEAPTDPVLIRAGEGVTLQRLITVMERLRGAGLTGLALIE